MTHSLKEGRHYSPREGWTERQKQVLHLLARGLTNAQVAELLGISLDGAKYHVSEVMTRLGVDTREEAAEYWRAYNGWPQRLKRFAGAIAAGVSLRWVGAAAAAVLLAGIAAVAIVMLQAGGEQQEASPEDEPVAVASETVPPATPSGTNGPDEPENGALTEIGGVPVRELSLGPEVPFPARAVLFYWRGCYGCGQPPFIWRAYAHESGTLVNEPITSPPSSEEGVDGFAISRDGSHLFATFCRGYCGGESESQPGSTKVALLSTDGGLTWEEGEPLPVTTWPMFRYRDQWLLSSWDEENRTGWYWMYETGAVLQPPASLPRTSPVLLGSGEVAWRQEGDGAFDAPAYFARDGSHLNIWPVPDRSGSLASGAGIEMLLAQVYPEGPFEEDNPLHLVTVDEAGNVGAALSWGSGWIGHPRIVSPGLLIATAEIPWELYPPGQNPGPPSDEFTLDFDVRAVLIDIASATMHPIAQLPRGPDGEWEYPGWYPGHNFTFPRSMVIHDGPLLRVETGGSCLNVREAPSAEAPTIRCYGDGVLLTERDNDDTPGGWLAVYTPDGREGWAAEQYLVR